MLLGSSQQIKGVTGWLEATMLEQVAVENFENLRVGTMAPTGRYGSPGCRPVDEEGSGSLCPEQPSLR